MYDRTDLVAVLAEYQRQASLPPMVLGENAMRAHAHDENLVSGFVSQVEDYSEGKTNHDG